MQRSLAISLVALPILYWYKMSRRSRALGLRSVFECLPKSWSSRLCIGIVISGLYYIFWVWYNFCFYSCFANSLFLTFRFYRSEEHTSELQSRENLVCRLLLEKKKYKYMYI